VRSAAKRLRDERGRSAESNFDRALAELGHRHQTWRVFSDFVEMAALSFAQAVIHTPEREERFERIRAGYNAEEYDLMARMLGYVVEGLEEDPCDFLGSAFMRNELGNHWQGQFFTPYHLSRLIASMHVDDNMRELVDARGYVTAHEPAAGAGGMLLALAEAMRDGGIEPQKHLLASAVDLSSVCAHMTLIQLSLAGIPAVVYVGDSLTLEIRERFETPAFHLGLVWLGRFRELSREAAEPRPATPTPALVEASSAPAPAAHPTSQLSLW
jgi:hypothetical protein